MMLTSLRHYQIVKSKFRTLSWFLSHPRYFPHAFYLLRMKLEKDMATTRSEAEEWCANRAITTEEALLAITGTIPSEGVESLHAAEFAYAQSRVDASPIQMGGAAGAANLSLLYYLTLWCEPRSVVETGVAYGWSSLALLLAIPKEGHVISINLPYLQVAASGWVGCVIPDALRSRWRLIEQSDRMALPWVLKELGQIDLCHYDSDKNYQGRIWAYPKLWQALRPGGIFMSDDVSDNVGFRDFCHQIGREPIVVKQNNRYIGILIKD